MKKASADRVKHKWMDEQLRAHHWKRKRGWGPKHCEREWQALKDDKTIKKKDVPTDAFSFEYCLPRGRVLLCGQEDVEGLQYH